MIKLITSRDKIREWIEHLQELVKQEDQQHHRQGSRLTPSRKLEERLVKLAALDGKTATHEEVAAIWGVRSPSLTHVHCDSCEEYVDEVVEVGEESDYDSATAALCRKCLAEAYELMKSYEGSA